MEFEDLSIVQKVIDALNKLLEPHGFELVLDDSDEKCLYMSISKVIHCASTTEDLRCEVAWYMADHMVNHDINFFTFPDKYKYEKFASQLQSNTTYARVSAARDIAKNILKIEFAELMLKLGLDALRTCTSFEELLLKLEVMKS